MSYDFEYYNGDHLKSPKKPTRPSAANIKDAVEARAYADAFEDYERNSKSYQEDFTYHKHVKSALMQEFKNVLRDDYRLSQEQFDYLWNIADGSYLQEKFNDFDRLYETVSGYINKFGAE